MSISKMYVEVNKLFKEGLNPTVNARLIPEDHSHILFNYLEKDTVGVNGCVNTEITIVVAYPGPVKERDVGIISSLTLTSENYSSEFYFQQLANQLQLLINDFLASIPEEYGIYHLDLETYSDAPNNQDSGTSNNQDFGAFNNQDSGTANNQYKTYGTTNIKKAGGCVNTCHQNYIPVCSNITIFLNNYEQVCNNSYADNGLGDSNNCGWINGSCQNTGSCTECG
jgi:hypothetical protein